MIGEQALAETGRAANRDASFIEARTLSFATLGEDGALLAELLKARKKAFIDDLGWDLPSAHGMEFDQYDTPYSVWVAVHRDMEILGGVRLTPTTARVMGYSYMLRDSQLGLLDGIPENVLDEEAPVDEQTWEASRVFIHGTLREKGEIRNHLLHEMLVAAADRGATRLLCILPSWWPRLARSGLAVKSAGPKMDMGGVQQAVEIDVLNSPLLNEGYELAAQ